MRTTRAILSGLAVVVFPAVVLAADQSINVTAEVPKFCKFDSAPTFAGLNNVTVASASTSSSVLNVTTATNATGIMNSAGFNFTIPATCNFPSQVTFTSVNGGLKDSSPTPVISGTFLNRIDYTATLFQWGIAGPTGLTTNGTANASASSASGAASSGSLQGNVYFQVNNAAPLAAGDYTDTLRISLAPQ